MDGVYTHRRGPQDRTLPYTRVWSLFCRDEQIAKHPKMRLTVTRTWRLWSGQSFLLQGVPFLASTPGFKVLQRPKTKKQVFYRWITNKQPRDRMELFTTLPKVLKEGGKHLLCLPVLQHSFTNELRSSDAPSCCRRWEMWTGRPKPSSPLQQGTRVSASDPAPSSSCSDETGRGASAWTLAEPM